MLSPYLPTSTHTKCKNAKEMQDKVKKYFYFIQVVPISLTYRKNADGDFEFLQVYEDNNDLQDKVAGTGNNDNNHRAYRAR